MKKNGFLTFCCACVPGCGQMYQGYMRRGTSLAAWFFGLVFLTSFTGLGALGIILPVIWAYAFFDTFNIRNLTPEQQAAFGDDFIPNANWLRQTKLDKVLSGGKTSRGVGIVLVVLGGLILYNAVFSRMLWYAREYIPFLGTLLDMVPGLIVAAVVIFLGIRLMQGKPITFGNKKNEDDFAPFTGGHSAFNPPYNGPRPFEHEGPQAYTPTAGENGSNFYANPAENMAATAPVAPPPPAPEPPTKDVVLTLGDDIAVGQEPAEATGAAAAPEAETAEEATVPAGQEAEETEAAESKKKAPRRAKKGEDDA